jgi:hypothetical protein
MKAMSVFRRILNNTNFQCVKVIKRDLKSCFVAMFSILNTGENVHTRFKHNIRVYLMSLSSLILIILIAIKHKVGLKGDFM